MEDKIKEAIEILIDNGYIVKRLTKQMKCDMDECEKSNGEKECFGCACSVCIAQ